MNEQQAYTHSAEAVVDDEQSEGELDVEEDNDDEEEEEGSPSPPPVRRSGRTAPRHTSPPKSTKSPKLDPLRNLSVQEIVRQRCQYLSKRVDSRDDQDLEAISGPSEEEDHVAARDYVREDLDDSLVADDASPAVEEDGDVMMDEDRRVLAESKRISAIEHIPPSRHPASETMSWIGLSGGMGLTAGSLAQFEIPASEKLSWMGLPGVNDLTGDSLAQFGKMPVASPLSVYDGVPKNGGGCAPSHVDTTPMREAQGRFLVNDDGYGGHGLTPLQSAVDDSNSVDTAVKFVGTPIPSNDHLATSLPKKHAIVSCDHCGKTGSSAWQYNDYGSLLCNRCASSPNSNSTSQARQAIRLGLTKDGPAAGYQSRDMGPAPSWPKAGFQLDLPNTAPCPQPRQHSYYPEEVSPDYHPAQRIQQPVLAPAIDGWSSIGSQRGPFANMPTPTPYVEPTEAYQQHMANATQAQHSRQQIANAGEDWERKIYAEYQAKLDFAAQYNMGAAYLQQAKTCYQQSRKPLFRQETQVQNETQSDVAEPVLAWGSQHTEMVRPLSVLRALAPAPAPEWQCEVTPPHRTDVGTGWYESPGFVRQSLQQVAPQYGQHFQQSTQQVAQQVSRQNDQFVWQPTQQVAQQSDQYAQQYNQYIQQSTQQFAQQDNQYEPMPDHYHQNRTPAETMSVPNAVQGPLYQPGQYQVDDCGLQQSGNSSQIARPQGRMRHVRPTSAELWANNQPL